MNIRTNITTANTKASIKANIKTSIIVLFFLASFFTSMVVWAQEPTKKDHKWHQVESEHFVIYYEAYKEDIALALLERGESFYADYHDVFNWDLKKVRIQVGMTGAIAGKFQFMPELMILSPTSPMLDAKDFNWMDVLFAHEFFHYVHLTYDRGLGGFLGKIIGPAGKQVVLATPRWMLEGAPTAFESDYTSIGRAQNTLFTMPVRADILLGNRDSYLKAQMTFLDDEQANYGRGYSYGLELAGYISSKYGWKTMMEIWQYFSKFPLDLSSRFKKFAGKTLFELHDEMIASLEERYAPFQSWNRGKEIEDKDNIRAVRKVFGGSDKGVLTFKSGADIFPTYGLFSTKDETTTKIGVPPPFSDLDFFKGQLASVSKDGSLIVYESGLSVQLYDTNTKEIKYILYSPVPVMATRPTISADKKYVYASQLLKEGQYSRLIRIDLEKEPAPGDGYDVMYEEQQSNISYKAVSPDGSKVVFMERSVLTGISLQLLDVETKEITTLVQRDYGIWMNSMSFVDDNTVFLASDIEHPGINAAAYTIDITTNTWTRIARDKVGIDTAALNTDRTLVYTSHNSNGYSIYTYAASELENEVVDIASIPAPDYFVPNKVQQYLTKETIANKASAKPRATSLSIEDIKYKKKRIYRNIPSQLHYAIPFLEQGKDTISLGYLLQFGGKADGALLQTKTMVHLGTFQPIYDISYAFNILDANVGLPLAMSLQTTRAYAYDGIDKNYFVRYTHAANIGMVPAAYLGGGAPGVGATISHENRDKDKITLADAFSSKIVETADTKLEIRAAFPFSWNKVPTVLIKEGLGTGFTPGVYYRPPVFNVERHEIQGIIDAFVQVPIGRVQAVRLSTYNSLSNILDYNRGIQTERYARRSTFPLFGFGSNATLKNQFAGGIGSVHTPLQSSFALDLILPFGPFDKGSMLFHPYKAGLGLFAEQTVGVDIESGSPEMKVSEYLITGLEVSVKIGILSFPIFLSLGSAYKIPYQDYVDFQYNIYIGLATDIHQVSGFRLQ